MRVYIIYIMRISAGRIGWSIVRALVPRRWYWRGWLALAKLLILVRFPLHWIGWLLSTEGPAVAGWRWLYGGRS